ncbi:MAG: TIGR04372 family glycosyltransferase, partial [Candidatus Omnitrophica bacterium]|nr:TIGR04372 family glycosyltransferase [Candidatus Omnitrophota bacterium]
AMKDRNDFLDIYLSAKCRFFLGSSAGLTAVPRIFRVPVAYANYLPFASILGITANALFIPKKLKLRKEGRLLTFREIFDSGIQNYLGSHEYTKAGIEILDNTPEEITALAMEMEWRIRGTWQTSKEDEGLQKCFWSFFKTRSHCRLEYRGEIPGVRIGAEFLRQNRELLKRIAI